MIEAAFFKQQVAFTNAWPEKDAIFREPGWPYVFRLMDLFYKLHEYPDLGYRPWPHHDVSGSAY